ncbi:MAG TPA: hypothetical protein VJT50_06880, partial [Pyrinomonadaceae bacterium]|nr:hypothetical protein [Pyrinomonadaceae bacterium]
GKKSGTALAVGEGDEECAAACDVAQTSVCATSINTGPLRSIQSGQTESMLLTTVSATWSCSARSVLSPSRKLLQ